MTNHIPDLSKTRRYSADDRQYSYSTLHAYFATNVKVYTLVTHVSQSGMSRDIMVLVGSEHGIANISHHVARILDWPLTRKGPTAVRVSGVGMDMGYHTVYSLSAALFGHGEDGRGGYRLKDVAL